MEISNAEKQARFRKKESLKRFAEELYWKTPWRMDGFEDYRAALAKAIDLPSGWTEEDYQCAIKTLKQISLEQFENHHLLENDVHNNRGDEFRTSPNPAKFARERKEAIERTRTLAAHIVSALKLSELSDADQAAAVMEVVRSLGRSLIFSPRLSKSKAVTMCMASIGPQYQHERPDWFAEELTEALAQNIGEGLARDVGQRLCKFQFWRGKNT